jgi:hypothetical protein
MIAFIPDSVAGQVHEREVPVTLEHGLMVATYAAFMADAAAIGLEDQSLVEPIFSRGDGYREIDGCGVITGDSDGRRHYYGVVIGPDQDRARAVAERILAVEFDGSGEQEDSE